MITKSLSLQFFIEGSLSDLFGYFRVFLGGRVLFLFPSPPPAHPIRKID